MVVNLFTLMRNPLTWIAALILLDSTKSNPRKKKRKSTRKGQVRKTARKAYKKKTTRTKRKTSKRKGRMRKGSPEAKAWGRKMKRLRSKK